MVKSKFKVINLLREHICSQLKVYTFFDNCISMEDVLWPIVKIEGEICMSVISAYLFLEIIKALDAKRAFLGCAVSHNFHR